MTSLHCAADGGHLKLVEFLLEQKANMLQKAQVNIIIVIADVIVNVCGVVSYVRMICCCRNATGMDEDIE